jgi:hypothetical protein
MKSWAYTDKTGRLLGTVKRIDKSGGKTFCQFQADGKPGGFGHPLYGLPRLQDPARAAHIFEGEKCADAGYWAGLIAVSTCGGASAGHLADVDPLNGTAVVVIHPDHDKPSRQRWTPALIERLEVLPQPPKVMICKLPDLPVKGDIVDWMQERIPSWNGFDVINPPSALKQQLQEVIRANMTPADKWLKQNHSLTVIDGGSGDWPKPDTLPALILPVAPFDSRLLPDKLRAWVMKGAENLPAPPDYIAAAVMTAAASVIGRKIAIRPKRHEPWQVVANLWGASVGLPSAKKSPSEKFAFRHLRKLQNDAMEAYQDECRQFVIDNTLTDAQIKQKEDELRTALKNSESDFIPEECAREIAELREKQEEPKPRRYFTSDATIQKLTLLLAENPNGLHLIRDELIGWLKTMEQSGKEPDRAYFLQTWDGDGSYAYDTVKRGTVYCQGMCLCVYGGIQPGPLLNYVEGSRSGGARDDGLLQRFQLMVWPDPLPDWKYVDEAIESTVQSMADAVFRHLDELTPEMVNATIPEERLPYLQFDDQAQQLFIDWLTVLNKEKIRPDEHPAIQAHLAKYESLMPSLALILHLADGHTGPVTVDAAAKAADWCEYLELHARRVYSAYIKPESRSARLLADKIKGRQIEDGAPIQKIYNAGWSGLDEDATRDGLRLLEDLNWVRTERIPPGQQGGRPSVVVHISPRVWEQ